MIDVCIVGAMGFMGRAIARAIEMDDGLRIVAGIDLQTTGTFAFPVYTSLEAMEQTPHVVVDFTRADNLDNVLSFCLRRQLPACICSTAHTPEQKAAVVEASDTIPIFFSYNNSLGVALLKSLISQCARVLGDAYDIEIVEKHHNRKIDAPSGTAEMLFGALNETRGGTLVPVYERHSELHKREKNEVGMLSFRGGTLAGEHSVFFAGEDELIEIRHNVTSREVFAAGTLRAIRFMAGKEPGLYNMNDVLGL
jgi:4-hydroxy-tetrahydrodipicolinate reductase